MERFSYAKFHHKLSAFYRARPRAAKALFWVDKTVTAFVFLAYAIGAILLIHSEKLFSKAFLRFALPPFSALLIVSALRLLIKRKRPYENGIEPLFKKEKTGNSFPSRHSTSAFSIGVTLLPVCFPLGISVLCLGITFLYTRAAIGWHYPSDLICGGILGGAIGAFAFL